MRSRFLMLILTLTFINCLIAQKPNNSKPVLSKTDVEHFVENYKNIEVDLATLDIDYKPTSNIESSLANIANVEEVNDILKKHGYTDFVTFSTKTFSIAACYATIKIEVGGSPELEKLKKDIAANPDLTKEQKEMALSQLEHGLQSIQKAFDTSANSADIATVRPYMEKLDKLFNVK